MATVFLSGSRRIGRLNDNIRRRLGNIVRQEMSIVIGDCNGADRAFQADLARIRYPNVKVFCSGRHCRNNLGGWPVEHVPVLNSLTKRDFYAQKDAMMTVLADYGFVLWDGKSSGSLGNIIRLLNFDRKVLAYLAPAKRLFSLKKMEDIGKLLEACDVSRKFAQTVAAKASAVAVCDKAENLNKMPGFKRVPTPYSAPGMYA